ncbi:MAG: DUF3467 domain-containing protein [Planctomycetota bacterium]|nr:DUF3467 domain-containing protein [Planctomycetota bacterium]
MSDETSPPEDLHGGQTVQQQHVAARVPEKISRGVFSNGVIVIAGGCEFVLDFLQNLGHPPQVASRVVLPHITMPQVIQTLQQNLDLYQKKFGAIAEIPRSTPTGRQQTPQEIYDELKLPDDLSMGVYANGVMIGHTATEFRFDFLVNLFPRPVVSARIFLAAPQVLRLLDSLGRNWEQFQQRARPSEFPGTGQVSTNEVGDLPKQVIDPPPPADDATPGS